MKGINPLLLLALIAGATKAQAENPANPSETACDCPGCAMERATSNLLDAKAKLPAAKAYIENLGADLKRAEVDLKAVQSEINEAQKAFNEAADKYNASRAAQ